MGNLTDGIISFVVFVVFISVLIIVVWLLVMFVLFLWNSLFGETPIVYHSSVPHTYEYARPKPREIIALDTEMVGAGDRGSINMLARVSMVDGSGWVYDKYVRPRLPVTDYRTPYSGISPGDILYAEDFYSVRSEVKNILQDCILVGHDLKNDLNILELTHPSEDIRDTALHIPFRRATKIMGQKPSLKTLAKVILEKDIQKDKHCSLEDAETALELFFEAVNNRERFT